MGLIEYTNDVRQEADIMCLLNNRGGEVKLLLKQMLKSSFGIVEEVAFCGNEYCVPKTINWGRGRSYARIDMLFKSKNYAIPVELKKEAGKNVLTQIKGYMELFKKSMGVIVTLHATKSLIKAIEDNEEKYHNIWVWDIREGKVY